MTAIFSETPMTSSDSGIDSCIEVDTEVKDGRDERDEVAASPSDSSSDDVVAATQTSTHRNNDIILCGQCNSEFPLASLPNFIEHKVSFYILA